MFSFCTVKNQEGCWSARGTSVKVTFCNDRLHPSLTPSAMILHNIGLNWAVGLVIPSALRSPVYLCTGNVAHHLPALKQYQQPTRQTHLSWHPCGTFVRLCASAAGLPTGHSRHTEQRHKRTAGKPRIICSLQVSCPTGPADMRVARRCYHCSVSRPGNPHNSAAGGLSQTAGWKFQRYPQNGDKGRTLAAWPSASLAVILRLGSSV